MSQTIKATPEQIKEIIDYYQGYLVYQETPHTIAKIRTERAVITIYATNTILFQGQDEDKEYHLWAQKWQLEGPFPKIEEHNKYANLSVIGCDEVGTGDYFGPIVVCSAYVSSDKINKLKQIGVKDSKLLTDDFIIELALKIKDFIPYSILVLSPERLNLLRQTNNDNLNFVKAFLHNNAINSILKKIPNVKYDAIIIDEFTSKENYFNYLKNNKNVHKNITLIPKGESIHVAIASASILARAAFLKEMRDLGKKYHTELLKGASSRVDRQAINIVKTHGLKALKHIAKMKFANTSRVMQHFKDANIKVQEN